MTDRQALTSFYRQNLEGDIIRYISDAKGLSLEQAMDAYYRSDLAVQIHDGKYGIDNMDYKYLAENLIENEPSLFQ